MYFRHSPGSEQFPNIERAVARNPVGISIEASNYINSGSPSTRVFSCTSVVQKMLDVTYECRPTRTFGTVLTVPDTHVPFRIHLAVSTVPHGIWNKDGEATTAVAYRKNDRVSYAYNGASSEALFETSRYTCTCRFTCPPRYQRFRQARVLLHKLSWYRRLQTHGCHFKHLPVSIASEHTGAFSQHEYTPPSLPYIKSH